MDDIFQNWIQSWYDRENKNRQNVHVDFGSKKRKKIDTKKIMIIFNIRFTLFDGSRKASFPQVPPDRSQS